MAHIHLLSIDNGNTIQNFLYDVDKHIIFREVVDEYGVAFKDYVKDNVRVQL